MKKQVILISGKQGSGKTTTANALFRALVARNKQEYPGLYKFADPLYTMHEYLLNFMERSTGKKRLEKDGPLLQWLGTEWGRKNFGENVWVDILRKRVDEAPNRVVIIDDCRFENEFDAFPEALKIRLDAPVITRQARCPAWRPNDTHASETGLDTYHLAGKFDMVFSTQVSTTENIVNTIVGEIYDRRGV